VNIEDKMKISFLPFTTVLLCCVALQPLYIKEPYPNPSILNIINSSSNNNQIFKSIGSIISFIHTHPTQMSSIFGSPSFPSSNQHYNSNVNNNPAASGKRPYRAVLGIQLEEQFSTMKIVSYQHQQKLSLLYLMPTQFFPPLNLDRDWPCTNVRESAFS
jgi:hypothetical protein